MGAFSLDNTSVETGLLVLSISPTSVLLLDDDRGQRDSTAAGQLMATVSAGDRAAVLAAMRDARAGFENAVAIVADDEGASAFVFGSMVVTAESDGARVTVTALDGQIDEIPLPSNSTSLTITPEGSIPLRTGEGSNATATAVRAARVRVELAPTPAVAPTPVVPPAPVEAEAESAEPAPAPAPSAPAAAPDNVDLIDLSPSDEAPSQSLPVEDEAAEDDGRERPQVLGVKCPRDHHNHPDAVYCAQCGLRMGVNQTLIAAMGPRPALGLLLLDDGTTHPIAHDMVVGREPHFHDLVQSGAADPLTINDPDLNLSRSHFAIRLVDWDVTAMDLGSANGTLFQRADATDWMPLSTSEATSLTAGDKLRAGSRVFQIQLHHIQT